jgi:hypothetical protein
MLDDYLATLEGHTFDGPLDRKEVKKKGKGGKAGYKVVEGQLTSESAVETKQKFTVTDAAKFQHFYSLIEDQELIRVIDLFDGEYWAGIEKGDLLEIEARLRVPEILSIIQVADEVTPLLDVLKMVGEDPLADPDSKAALEGISSLSRTIETKPIPLIFETISTPGYSFACNLPRQFMRCPIQDLEGEATVFAKVIRLIPKGSHYSLFSLLPTLGGKLPSLSKQKQMEMESQMADQGFAEIATGPGLLIAPLAIYR